MVFERDMPMENMWGPVPRITGKFVDSNGEPLGGAKLRIFAYNDYTGRWDFQQRFPVNVANIVTNEDGSFHTLLENIDYEIAYSSRLLIYCLKRKDDGSYYWGNKLIERSYDNIDENNFENYSVIVESR